MKKSLIRSPLLLLIILGSLISCRTEDELIQSNQQPDNKFQAFTSKNGEPVNYPLGYKLLLEKYDSIHSTAYTSKTFFKNSTIGKSGSEEYVELNIRSQELMMKSESERWILYPVVKQKEVIGIEVGILKNNETQLEFWRIHPQDDYYKEIIGSFRLAYSEKILEQQTMSKGGNCGRPGEEPCDTGEVIITIPKPNGPKANPHLYLPGANPGSGDPGVIGGGCGAYGNCDGGGGTGPIPYNENEDDPCKKTKDMLRDQKVKNAIDDLKDHMNSGKGGEKGWKFNKDGTSTETAENDSHSIVIGDPSLLNGTYHNHTGTKVDIFSATDISTLLEIVRYQSIGNTGNGFSGMVAPNGIHYVMYFDGAHTDLPPSGSFSEADLGVWNIQMWRLQQRLLKESGYYDNINGKKVMNSKGLEMIFFDAIKKMGLENKIVLQRIEDLNKVSTIAQSQDGTTVPIPCQ